MTKQASTVLKARKLRKEMTLPEVMQWQQMRADPQGLRFRRQHPIGPFVLDFYCAKARLAVEVDGMVHDMGDRPQVDQRRGDWLRAQGIEFLRFPATKVLKGAEDVASAIVRIAVSRCD